ncbi:hypothetical protein ACWEQL_00325 [Kitasatospora sp. NPDC004240]
MPRVTAHSPGPALRPQVRWLVAAASILAIFILYSPLGPTPAMLADLLAATGALAVLAGWRSPRRRTGAHRARVTVAKAAPVEGLPSETYELTALGVSVLIRLREDWKGQPLVPYVHIEQRADRPRLLLVEVDNRGETEYR